MRKALATSLSLATMVAVLTGCPAREVAQVDPAQSKEQQKSIPVDVNRNLDILFVIDNSGSMSEEQASLSSNFVSFINVLRNIEGGLPNVHIGVVTTDMGGPQADTACSTSDNGELVTDPAFTGNFIQDLDDGDGGRLTNYNGTLESAFSSVATLGTSGCGFEQPLRAMRTALESPANAGFIRDDAFLAVIFITDEDDCSVTDNGMFGTQCDTIDGSCTLGPLHSYRCFEFGVKCEPDRPREVGPRLTTDCAPRDDSPYMATPDDFAEFLRGFKVDPSLIITAGIIAPPDEQTIVNLIERTAANGTPLPDALELEPSCTSSSGSGFPGIRLRSFFDEFPSRSTVTTICNDDLTDALVQIADLLARLVGSPCLEGNLVTPPECTVTDVRFADQPNEERGTPMPVCTDDNPDPELNTSTNTPCYVIAPDPECNTETGLKLTVVRSSDPAIGTETQVRCVAN